MILFNVASIFAIGTLYQDLPDLESLQKQVAEIAATSRTPDESDEALAGFPAQSLVLAVSDALTRSAFQDAKTRGLSYRILSEHAGAKTDHGYKALLLCLDDSRAFLGLCAAALTQAPQERFPEVADRLVAVLTAPHASDVDQEVLLKAIAKLGMGARKHLNVFETIYLNHEANERVRWFSAACIIHVAGVEHALRVFNLGDQTGLKVALWELTRLAADTKGAFDAENKETRNSARDFLRKHLKHPDLEIRQLTLDALQYAYGDDAVRHEDGKGWILNPEFVSALQSVSQNDPDGKIREKATRLLVFYQSELAKEEE